MKTGPRPQEWHHWRQVCGGGFEPAPTDYMHLLARLSAVRIHGPPGPVELPGVDRLSCRPAFQQTVRTTRATTTRAGWAQRSLPVPSMLQRFPILGGSDGSRPRRAVARRLSYDRARGRMGARVMASGMPEVSRRAVLGGATYSVGKVSVRLRGAGEPWQRHNQRHIPGARPARGANPRRCPAGSTSLSLRQADYLSKDRAEARARGEYSTGVLGCVKELPAMGRAVSLLG